MAIAQATILNTTTTLYTSSGTTAVTVIYIVNDSASPITLQLYVVPSGGSATAATRVVKDLAIAAGDTYIMDTERLVLDNGDTIRAAASVTGVSYSTISYIGV